MTTIKNLIIDELQGRKCRSAWDKGVNTYALELLEQGIPAEAFESWETLKKALLNGADNWSQYSYGGCALIYNGDIAERLCSPSEYRKRKGGEWMPNRYENWLDVQARALSQACRRIITSYKDVMWKIENEK